MADTSPSSRMLHLFYTILGVVGVAFVVMCLGLYAIQDKLLFVPTSHIYRTPEEAGWAFEDLMVEHEMGKTHAWYIPADGLRKGVVLFSHGNAGNIADRIESAGIFRALGYDTLVYDYGGYGRSDGTPSEKRCYADVRAAWDYLTKERRIDPKGIVLFGRSLGAAMTCDLAQEVNAAGVVMESPFISVPEVGKGLYPFLPVRLLSRNKFDNGEKVSRISSPLLVIHSRDDRLIPFRHGERVFQLANEPKTFMEIQGGHNDGFVLSGDKYIKGSAAFLASCVEKTVEAD